MSPPHRIALAITELDVGGAERCLVNLATGLDRARFEPAVFCLAPRPEPGGDRLVQILQQAGVPVHFLELRSPWQIAGAIRRLRRLLAEQAPDVVQTFLFHANVVGALACGGRGGPAIVTGVRVADPTRWRQRLEAWTSRRVDRIVCVSRSVADYCADRARFPKEKLIVIPNGIDVRVYSSARRSSGEAAVAPAGRRMLLFVGRLHPQKGTDWLLSLAPQLLGRLPEHDLVLVGEGPQRAILEKRAAEQGLTGRVHFAGWRADVPDLLAACDLLLLPSRWEGMPNIVLEAMASERPVTATRADGVGELLGTRAEQQTADYGDDARFVDTAVHLVQDRDLAGRIGQANRRRAVELFSLPSMISAYEQLYDSLAKGCRRS